MTQHVHVFCNRCGREVGKEERGVQLVRSTYASRKALTNALISATPDEVGRVLEQQKTVDLCDGCDDGHHRWIGDRKP